MFFIEDEIGSGGRGKVDCLKFRDIGLRVGELWKIWG